MNAIHTMSLTEAYRYYYTAIIMLSGRSIAYMAPYRDTDSFIVTLTGDVIAYQVLGTVTVHVQYA
jgi:hypothetical protein